MENLPTETYMNCFPLQKKNQSKKILKTFFPKKMRTDYYLNRLPSDEDHNGTRSNLFSSKRTNGMKWIFLQPQEDLIGKYSEIFSTWSWKSYEEVPICEKKWQQSETQKLVPLKNEERTKYYI